MEVLLGPPEMVGLNPFASGRGSIVVYFAVGDVLTFYIIKITIPLSRAVLLGGESAKWSVEGG